MTTASEAVVEPQPGEDGEPRHIASAYESDLAFAREIGNGDVAAYEALVRGCGPQVLGAIRRYLHSDADVADCFQETFIAVLNSIDSYAGQSSLRQWVRGVAVKQCLMALRSRKRIREDSIEHLLPEFDESGQRVGPARGYRETYIEAQLDSDSLRQSVRQCIQELPDDYRVVLLMRDIDGYSTRETADFLGIRTNAVKTRLHRARAALRTIMEPLLGQVKQDADL